MLVTCSKCDARFVLRLKVQYLANEVERYYFRCSECGEEYTTYYCNPAIKKLQEKLIQLRQKYDGQKLTDPKQAVRTFEEWLKGKEELGKAMHLLLTTTIER